MSQTDPNQSLAADEAQQLKDIERLTQQQLERKIVAGFEPGEPLPAGGALQPPKRKRPKKAKPAHARSDNGGGNGQNRQARPANNNSRPGGNSQRRRRPAGNRRPQAQQS